MQILYGFSNCSDRLYRKLTANLKTAVSIPVQKYHGLLIKGLVKNGAKVTCLSGLPINRTVTKKLLIREPEETENGALYHYYTTLNVPGLRQLTVFFGAIRNVLRALKNEPAVAVCDCLNIANAFGMAIGCRMKKIPLVLIVTDLPDMLSFSRPERRIGNRLFAHADGFIFLTEAMNGRLNQKQKPYLVMEGHADADVPVRDPASTYERTEGKKVVLYAGSLMEIYGIGNLTEGFLEANVPGSELWIYGDGDYRAALEKTAQAHETIRYFGVCDNQTIVEREQKASLLVNPRPSDPEYTKYSFPSKNMEYMASGTPVYWLASKGQIGSIWSMAISSLLQESAISVYNRVYFFSSSIAIAFLRNCAPPFFLFGSCPKRKNAPRRPRTASLRSRRCLAV